MEDGRTRNKVSLCVLYRREGRDASVPCNGKVGLHFWGWTVEVGGDVYAGVDAFRSNLDFDYDQNNHISRHISH